MWKCCQLQYGITGDPLKLPISARKRYTNCVFVRLVANGYSRQQHATTLCDPLKPSFLSQIIPAEKRESPPCGGLGGRWMRLSGKPCARADHCTTSLTRMATLGGIKNPPPSKRGTARDGVGENGQQSHRPCAKGSGCGLLGAVRAVAALSVRALYCSHRAVSLLDSHLAALT